MEEEGGICRHFWGAESCIFSAPFLLWGRDRLFCYAMRRARLGATPK